MNEYRIFETLNFTRADDRVRYVTWMTSENSCTVLLRASPDAEPIELVGKDIGEGVVKFNATGLPFEYLFRQVPPDTILVSRTEQSECEDCGGGAGKVGICRSGDLPTKYP